MAEMLVCPNCGQNNRIQDDEDELKAICAKCWTRLKVESRRPVPPPKPEGEYIPAEAKKDNTQYGTGALIIIGALIVVAMLFISSRETKEPYSSTVNKEIEEKQNYPVVQMPRNGETQVFTNRERVAPLTIKTSGKTNYFVKLVSANSQQKVMTIFVKGGNTVSTEVPLGSYEIRYATGSQWYGYDHLFGSDTGYSKADNIFRFENQGNQVSGYTITLYQVRNGNLRTKQINANSF